MFYGTIEYCRVYYGYEEDIKIEIHCAKVASTTPNTA